ncbi:MAG: RsmE family RNA methyltransferase [Isosphaeraceae bacterium]
MADRFYCPGAAGRERLVLEGDEARHLARVLRLGVGAWVEVFDGLGGAWKAEVAGVSKSAVELQRTGPPLPDCEPGLSLTIATAVPKGERFDWLVEKATEIGVRRLVPVRTERSVVDPGSAKLERIRRAVVEASKQCGRNRLMEVGATVDLPALLQEARPGLRVLAHPGGRGLASVSTSGSTDEALLLVGPEGGFTDAEVEAAERAGFERVGLGPTILRVETAAVVGCAVLLTQGLTERGKG